MGEKEEQQQQQYTEMNRVVVVVLFLPRVGTFSGFGIRRD
jgi:hypothetical protein